MDALVILSFWLVSLSTVVVVWLSSSCHTQKQEKQRRPPGPWTLPIIGSLHHLVSVAPPHRKITELCRRHGPLMSLKLGELNTVVVSSAEAAELVMKTNDIKFASRPNNPTQQIISCGGRGIVFAPYGDHWRQMRKVCTVELLSSTQVRRMDHGVRPEEVGSMLGRISISAAGTAAVNLSEMAMSLTNNVVSRAVFGGKFIQQEDYIRELDVVLTLLGGFCLVDLFPSSRLARLLSTGARQMKTSYARMQRIIQDVIDERAAAGENEEEEEDLLDVLLRLQKEDSSLTTETICAVLFDIFSAATDTTGTALEWAMSELVRHPHVMAKAQAEIQHLMLATRQHQQLAVITHTHLAQLQYLRMVIKEVLRLHLPAPLIPRMTRQDCKILGYDMPNGTVVLVNIFSVSRDPKYWKNPEEFLPERFADDSVDYNGTNFEFTPFGAGRRQCPGMLFATSTLEIALANLIYHFDWVLPAPGGASPAESLDMSEKFGMTVGRKYDLELIAIPRFPS
uniref:Uncharacterized protein n=1 Tax=Avena sativa TaxID=4498 RepID=A0ACD5ZB98_AVESA